MTTAYYDPSIDLTWWGGYSSRITYDSTIYKPIEVDLDEWDILYHYIVDWGGRQLWTPVLDLYKVMFSHMSMLEHDTILLQGLQEGWIVCLPSYVECTHDGHKAQKCCYYIHKDHIPELAATLFKKRVLK